jgi:hypothetical protein
VRERPAILYWTVDPECLGAFVAHDIEHTWVFMHAHDPETEPIARFTEPACAAIVRRAIGRADVDFVVRDVSPWTMTAQVAERYRAGHVFLLGDSAHRFPPSGGMGMNTGVQDAHNLAWKLAAVTHGWAGTPLLDTYETERRPIAQQNADQSLANAMRMLELLMELGITPNDGASRSVLEALLADDAGRERVQQAVARQQDHFDMLGLQLGIRYEAGALVPDGSAPPAPANPVRDYLPTTCPGARLPHAWIEQDGERRSILDLVAADGLTLIAGADGPAWKEAARRCTLAPLRSLVAGRDFTDPHGHWARVCELASDGALLVRPDQHVGWRASTASADPTTTLRTAVRALTAS